MCQTQSSSHCMVYKDKVAYRGGSYWAHTVRFSPDTASSAEEFEVPLTRTPSGMTTEVREQLAADYLESVEKMRRKFILTVWVTSVHLKTAAQSPLVSHNGHQST